MLTSQPLPKPILLSEMLIREIAAGRLVTGSRLHTERQLAAHFGVAVGTLRKALLILEEKGMLERVQGSGNYVKEPEDPRSIYGFFRLELHKGGGFPSARVLDVQRLPKPDFFPEMSSARTAHRIRRLRFLDETPIALEEIWLDGRYNKKIVKEDLSDSLYYFYQQTLDLMIGNATDRVSVGTVPDWVAEPFDMESGQTCGYIERDSEDQFGQLAEFSRTWYDQKKAHYAIRHR